MADDPKPQTAEEVLAQQKKDREEAIAAEEKRMADAQPTPTQEEADRIKLGLPVGDDADAPKKAQTKAVDTSQNAPPANNGGVKNRAVESGPAA